MLEYVNSFPFEISTGLVTRYFHLFPLNFIPIKLKANKPPPENPEEEW